MAIQAIKLGGFVDEEVAKINSNFAEIDANCAKTTDIPNKTSDLTNDSGFITSAAIPEIPSKTSDLTNDSGFITGAAIENKVDKVVGKGLSENDFTEEHKAKVDKLGKIDFTTSSWGSVQSDGYFHATLPANGKYPVKVMRKSGSDYEESLTHAKVSGSNIVLYASEAFEGYVVTI